MLFSCKECWKCVISKLLFVLLLELFQIFCDITKYFHSSCVVFMVQSDKYFHKTLQSFQIKLVERGFAVMPCLNGRFCKAFNGKTEHKIGWTLFEAIKLKLIQNKSGKTNKNIPYQVPDQTSGIQEVKWKGSKKIKNKPSWGKSCLQNWADFLKAKYINSLLFIMLLLLFPSLAFF